ncbi:flagellar protein FlaG [Planococcus donghaensis MPA1U2]|uniref:Flagellar protein FlaG n=1 Tax=Planococcus donghaensis MPA1U2 TaxID=933115 RepID=E7RIY9_9BACL|nr:flagellar protein FlaG [Planococcus donghaensis]EGA88999.1 flagellar protein FlaG [Planococcus donghaensis MPA1U2]
MEVTKLPAIEFPRVSEPNPIGAKQPIAAEEQQNKEFDKPITKEALTDKVDSMNKFLESTTTNVKFQFHEEMNVYYVQVVNSLTEEILREIPNKKFLDMYASMADLAGLMVDEKL